MYTRYRRVKDIAEHHESTQESEKRSEEDARNRDNVAIMREGERERAAGLRQEAKSENLNHKVELFSVTREAL